MLHPMHELFDAIAPCIPRPLLDESWAHRIRGLAAQLPSAFHTAVLECRLGHDDPRVDFSVCAWGNSRDWRRCVAALPSEAAVTTPRFEELDVKDSFLEKVPLIWLEYDVLPAATAPPIVFLAVDPAFFEVHAARPLLTGRQLRDVAECGLPWLVGRPVDRGTLDCLMRCAERLPPGGRVLHIASMWTRGTRNLRVCCDVPVADIPGWLHEIGWPGDPRCVERALEVCEGRSSLGVHVEVSERVEPYVSFEYTISSGCGLSDDYRPFLERLPKVSAAAPDKLDAVQRWPGDSPVRLPSAPWLVRISRGLNFKLVPRADGAFESKAYLYFQPNYTLL